MRSPDLQQLHEQASKELFDLSTRRNAVLDRLAQPALFASGLTPDTGMVAVYDTAEARTLLVEIDDLTLKVSLAIEVVNRYARQLRKPEIRWQSNEWRHD